MLEITAKNFEEEVAQSDIPVVLDFWASWCGPCRALGPFFEKVANEYEGKVKAGKVDVQSQQSLAAKFGITSIPVVLAFKDGDVVDRMTGFSGTDDQIRRLFQSVAE